MANSTADTTSAFERWLALAPDDAPADNNPLRHESSPAEMARTRTDLPLLVVGAGPAGLAGMAALARANVAFEAVESHSRAGGIWDETNPLSSIYEGLHTVTSRFTTHLGPPMPTDWSQYPHHRLAHDYLLRFAESEQLLSHIRFNTRFLGAEKIASGAWRVTLERAGGDTYEKEFRGLVFATGSHNKLHADAPRALWDQATAAGLHAVHSAEYSDPTPYAGKRVLVVGVGNSGSDIAEKVSAVAQRTLLAVRTSPWINPPAIDGIPCDKLAADAGPRPGWLGMQLFMLRRRLAIGSFRSLGLSRPRCALNDRLPISDRGIVKAIRAGRVIVRSQVTELTDGVAHFAERGHPSEPIDAVIFATGFARQYPLLRPSTENAPLSDALLFLTFHRSEPGLAYLAEVIGLRSCWPMFVEQGRAIAAYFAAEERGGDNIACFNARRGLPSPEFKGRLFRRADGFHVDYEIYAQVMRELTEWLEKIDSK